MDLLPFLIAYLETLQSMWNWYVSRSPSRIVEWGSESTFYQACREAKWLGADKLYISAHFSKESQAAYKALGCVHAKEINPKLSEKEPCDVQFEYVLD